MSDNRVEMGDVVKATKEGKLYIETKDFFAQEKVQDTIKKLIDAPLTKEINERQRKAQQEKGW